MNRRTLKLSALLFCSGLCALIYQTTWIREIRLVFGASTSASAAVLGLFMGGLGLGGWLFGRRAERHPRPLALYAQLELAISVTAALSPYLISAARSLYLLTGGSEALGMTLATVVRLLLSTVVLGGTTVLMGGTLPAAARFVEQADDPSRRRIAVLLGANTLGAVVGVALSTFFLLEVLGNRSTLWCACLVNALVAIVARVWARRDESPAPASSPPAPAEVVAAAAPRQLVLAAALGVGFAFMLMELVWYRSLAPILGGSTYTFGLVLLMALLGIGLGGAAYARWGVERRATLHALAFTCALEALLVALPLFAGDSVAVAASLLRELDWFGFKGLVASWAMISTFVVLPGAIVAGYQFPLLIALLGKGGEQVGRQVGLAYAWNTIGAIIGSLAGGFGLIPSISAVGTWRLAVVLLALLGLVAAVTFVRRERAGLKIVAPVALSALALAASFSAGPTTFWRHTAIGAGRARPPGVASLNGLVDWQRTTRRNIFWERDGVESSVGLDSADGVAFVVNGKIDGNSLRDVGTQVMGGVLPALLHPDPKRALVIGLGTGSTAGWLAAVPSMERVDVAEIEPAIIDVARACAPVNQQVLDNPKTHLFVGDARELLINSRAQYDIIFSEPSNPYRAGISSLYTHEYYQAAKSRLAEHGLFVQWVQTYEVQASTVRSVLATLGGVFPEAELWATEPGDLVIVASSTPIPHDVNRLRERVQQEPFATALRVGWQVDDVEGVLSRYLAGPNLAAGLTRAFADEVNTDDQNLIEFAYARSVGRATTLSIPELIAAGQQASASRPLVTGEVDWARVAELQALSPIGFPIDVAQIPGDAGLRARLFTQAGSPRVQLRRWSAARLEPKGELETMLLARVMAAAGDARAETYCEPLRAHFPAEVALLTAQLRLKQGRVAEAGEQALQGLASMRTEIWTDRGVASAMFQSVLPELATRDHALGRRLFDAVKEPFPVRAFNGARLELRLALAERADFAGLCAQALDDLEPWPPWTRTSLASRVRCEKATRDQALSGAQRDWERFLANEPSTLLGQIAEPEAPALAEPPEEAEMAPPDASVP